MNETDLAQIPDIPLGEGIGFVRLQGFLNTTEFTLDLRTLELVVGRETMSDGDLIHTSILAANESPAPDNPYKITDVSYMKVSSKEFRKVSHQHCRMFWDFEKRQWMCEILGRNGVQLNGRKMQAGMSEQLPPRTCVSLNEGKIFFVWLPCSEDDGSLRAN